MNNAKIYASIMDREIGEYAIQKVMQDKEFAAYFEKRQREEFAKPAPYRSAEQIDMDVSLYRKGE